MVKNNGYCSNNRNRCSKNCFKRIVKKTPEATGNLTGNKIAVKITSVGKSKEKKKNVIEFYIPPETRQQTIDDLKFF